MNKAVLANLTGIAERAIRAGLVFEPNEMIAAGQAMGQAREMLTLMKDHHHLAIADPAPITKPAEAESDAAGRPAV